MVDSSRVLILVDVQNGFCSSENAEQVARLRELCESMAVCTVIATQFINRQDSLFERALDWHEMRDDADIELVDELRDLVDVVVQKNTYSCNGGLISALRDVYKSSGDGSSLPAEVLIAGCDTEACVYATAIRLFDYGVLPIIVEDCCWSSGGRKMHDSGITIMRRTLGKRQLILSSEL